MGEETTVQGRGVGELRGQGAERQPAAFNLDSEVSGVDAGTVRESSRTQENTHVPDAPEFVGGMVDLPDNVIPVNDLGTQFHLFVGEGTKNAPYRRRGRRRRGCRGHRPRRDRGCPAGRRRDRSGFDDDYD